MIIPMVLYRFVGLLSGLGNSTSPLRLLSHRLEYFGTIKLLMYAISREFENHVVLGTMIDTTLNTGSD